MKRIVKKKINDNYNFNLIDTNKDSKWIKFLKTPGIIPEVPRKSAVSKFRLITGHDCLSTVNISIKLVYFLLQIVCCVPKKKK